MASIWRPRGASNCARGSFWGRLLMRLSNLDEPAHTDEGGSWVSCPSGHGGSRLRAGRGLVTYRPQDATRQCHFSFPTSGVCVNSGSASSQCQSPESTAGREEGVPRPVPLDSRRNSVLGKTSGIEDGILLTEKGRSPRSGPRANAPFSKEETASRRQIQPRHYIPGSLDTARNEKDSDFPRGAE